MTTVKTANRRRTLGATVLFAMAAVVFAVMIALLVARSLNVSALQEQLADAQSEIAMLRDSNQALTAEVALLTQEAADNRALLIDVLDELDAEERRDLRERVEGQEASREASKESRRRRVTAESRDPPERPERDEEPREPEPEPEPSEPPEEPGPVRELLCGVLGC